MVELQFTVGKKKIAKVVRVARVVEWVVETGIGAKFLFSLCISVNWFSYYSSQKLPLKFYWIDNALIGIRLMV